MVGFIYGQHQLKIVTSYAPAFLLKEYAYLIDIRHVFDASLTQRYISYDATVENNYCMMTYPGVPCIPL